MASEMPKTVEQVIGRGCICFDHQMRGLVDPECAYCEVKDGVQLLLDRIAAVERENRALRELLNLNVDLYQEYPAGKGGATGYRYGVYVTEEDKKALFVRLHSTPAAAIDAALARLEEERKETT